MIVKLYAIEISITNHDRINSGYEFIFSLLLYWQFKLKLIFATHINVVAVLDDVDVISRANKTYCRACCVSMTSFARRVHRNSNKNILADHLHLPRTKREASIVFWSCQIRWIIHSTTSRFSREQETAHIQILFFIESLESLLKKKKKRRWWWWWWCEREGGKITLEQQQRKYIYFIVSLSLSQLRKTMISFTHNSQQLAKLCCWEVKKKSAKKSNTIQSVVHWESTRREVFNNT